VKQFDFEKLKRAPGADVEKGGLAVAHRDYLPNHSNSNDVLLFFLAPSIRK